VVHSGIDLHKRESQICWLDADTGETSQRRIQTRRDRFEAVFGGQPPAQVLIEAGTESEWVASCIEALGHQVYVVDPNYAPMYPRARRGRHKNDQRDAAALAEASVRGTYRPVHRVTTARRRVRQVLAVRDSLVRTRTRMIAMIRATVRGEGLRIPSGEAESFVARVRGVALPDALLEVIGPALLLLEILETQLGLIDHELARCVAGDATMQRLQTAPGIGPITSAAFVAAVDTPTRFRTAGQISSYLGLVPKDDSSGDRHRGGRITKAGPKRMRALLVEAAWRILERGPADLPLRQWAEGVARRGGRPVAAVGLARRLARILWAMWRDGTDFDASQTQGGRKTSVPAETAPAEGSSSVAA
jgi:transposase